MGVTKKAKITFTCEPSLKDGLEEWAQSESRTLSNLIEMLIRQAYEERFSSADRTTDPQQSKPQQSKPQQSKPQQSKPQQSEPQQSEPLPPAAKRTAAKSTTAATRRRGASKS
jgi:hypothetical protein